MKTLFLIPARGGSKRIPKKNSRKLKGKPLVLYSIEYARQFASDEDICLSTDCPEIIGIADEVGLHVPFIRPDHLATDQASSAEVIYHAFRHYVYKNIQYDRVILLQPTSPYRLKKHLDQALKMWQPGKHLASVSPEGTLNGNIFIYCTSLPLAIEPQILMEMDWIFSLDIDKEIDLHLSEHIYGEVLRQQSIEQPYREFES